MQIEYRKDNTDQFTAELRQVVGERGSKSQEDIKRKRKLPNKRLVIWVSLIAIAFCAVIIALVLGATKEERKIGILDCIRFCLFKCVCLISRVKCISSTIL